MKQKYLYPTILIFLGFAMLLSFVLFSQNRNSAKLKKNVVQVLQDQAATETKLVINQATVASENPTGENNEKLLSLALTRKKTLEQLAEKPRRHLFNPLRSRLI